MRYCAATVHYLEVTQLRKIIGPILIGLGAFLLVVAVLAVTWLPGAVKKTPLDVNQKTLLSGEVQRLEGDALSAPKPINVVSLSQTDTDESTDDVVLWRTGACVVVNEDGNAPECVDGKDPRLVSATEDVFATDRVTAEAVPDFKNLPPDAVPHEGLVNKWPFDSEKKDYVYWESTLEKGVPAVFDRTDSIKGIDVYVYTITVADEPIEILDGAMGTYDQKVEIWVEPLTGAIQQQTQDQQRYLEDGTQVLNLQVGFTDGQINAFAEDTKANVRQLTILLDWVPIIGFVGGALCLLGGVALVLTNRRKDAPTRGGARKEKVSV